VDFGSNDYGILRATVAGILHTVEEGLVNRLLSVLFDPTMPETMKASIDKLVEELFCMGRNWSGDERDRFPAVSFQKGYSSLTLLSANERLLGQLFVVAILLHTPEGRELFSPRFEYDFDEKRKVIQERFKIKDKYKGRKNDDDGWAAAGTSLAGAVLTNEGGSDDDSSAGGAEKGNGESDRQKGNGKSERHFQAGDMENILRKLDLAYIIDNIMPTLNEDSLNKLNETIKKAVEDKGKPRASQCSWRGV
jgi:hypothetical protein